MHSSNTGEHKSNNTDEGHNNHHRHRQDQPPDHGLRIRLDPPCFNGDNTEDWIDRIETYFDYHETPTMECLYLVQMLMDPPASVWFCYYRSNNCESTWEDFLQAIRHRFDPDYYIDHVCVLSILHQTTSVQDYQTAFEGVLEKVSGVAESTLISLFIVGLKQTVQGELNIRRPNPLAAVFVLARELEAPSPRSLRIIGFVKDTPLQVLLHGGSTHYFIHPVIAEKLSLPLTSVKSFRVYVVFMSVTVTH